MENTEKYFSLVSDRIVELQEELKSVQKKKENSTHTKTIERYQLEEDFITKKIAYLSRLVNLPTLILISNLTEEQVEELRRDKKIPEDQDASYLIHAFGLKNLQSFIEQPKIVTMSHIKDAFIGDFDALADFLSMQQRNLEIIGQREKLYGVGLNKEMSYLKLSHEERKLNLDEENTNTLIGQADNDFNLQDLREISELIANSNKRLPIEFIQKHSEKVVKENPDMKKVVKRLSRKRWFGWMDKFLPNRRRKREKEFMDSLVAYYDNSSVAADLDIVSNDLFYKSDEELVEFTTQVQKRCRIRRNQIVARRNHINISKQVILNKIRVLESEQNSLKDNFTSLIRTKTSFLPKSFQEQIWKEPNLKQSCMNEACYLEEKQLIEKLTNLLKGQATTSLTTISNNIVEVNPKVKQLVA